MKTCIANKKYKNIPLISRSTSTTHDTDKDNSKALDFPFQIATSDHG